MPTTFLNQDVLRSLRSDEFLSREPFPWLSTDQLLTDEAFATLLADFPPVSQFTWTEGLKGQHYERPQDRYLLLHDPSDRPRPGSIDRSKLPESWRGFIDELQTNDSYRRYVAACLGREGARMYFTWHLGVTGSEVCPHIDKDTKVATHIFYFNTKVDWDPAWGGSLLVLSDRLTGSPHPDFADFGQATPVENLGNRSFFFKNGPQAWHGVKPLTCPEGAYRRLFNVIFELPEASAKPAPVLSGLKIRVTRVLDSIKPGDRRRAAPAR